MTVEKRRAKRRFLVVVHTVLGLTCVIDVPNEATAMPQRPDEAVLTFLVKPLVPEVEGI